MVHGEEIGIIIAYKRGDSIQQKCFFKSIMQPQKNFTVVVHRTKWNATPTTPKLSSVTQYSQEAFAGDIEKFFFNSNQQNSNQFIFRVQTNNYHNYNIKSPTTKSTK